MCSQVCSSAGPRCQDTNSTSFDSIGQVPPARCVRQSRGYEKLPWIPLVHSHIVTFWLWHQRGCGCQRDRHWPPITTFSLSGKGRDGKNTVMGKTLSHPLAGSSFPPQQVANCGTRSGSFLTLPRFLQAAPFLACWVGFPITIIKGASTMR
jgi:hypothetical protein